MSKRYYIDVSRKDIGLVSYFPVAEVMKKPDDFWVEKVLFPALIPLVKRRDKNITNVPITFWVTARSTARRKAEAFVFVTPDRPGARIEEALKRAFQTIKGANVHAGREPIPHEAFTCFQVFRNKVLRFYFSEEEDENYYMATIEMGTGFPKLILSAISDDFIDDWIYDNVLLVRAEISSSQSGRGLRLYQQALGTIAREAE